MTRPLLCLAALASATVLALGQPAFAGSGGVRLSFGGPLGTFVATPTPGYGGNGYATSPRKHAPRLTAARPAASPAIGERQKSARTRPVVPVRLDAIEKRIDAAPVTAATAQTPGMLSRALAADSLPRREIVQTLPPSERIVAQDAPSAPAKSAVISPAVKETPKAETPAAPATCRKFIPAVGVTVTVGCP